MSFLCSSLRPRRVLEIGMFTGTMTTIFASADSVEKVVSLEAEGFLEGWCRPFWEKAGRGISEKIEVRIGFASQSLEKMAREGEEAFDLVRLFVFVCPRFRSTALHLLTLENLQK